MPSLWFVVPVHGRQRLARICLEQLRRTCDALADVRVWSTAVIVGDDENIDTARDLGFATVQRDNKFLSARFNDGIQAACDPHLVDPPMTGGRYQVGPRRSYRGHQPGSRFTAVLDPRAEARALYRGDIMIVERGPVTFDRDTFTPPDGWDGRPASFVVPCGSDDWVDHRILTPLPGPGEVRAFRKAAFVSEDGQTIAARDVDYQGGVGIRVYPRQLLAATNYRPADEDRERACDTSILVNVTRANPPHIVYGDLHQWQIVDWKTRGEQLNDYQAVTARFRRGADATDPFTALRGIYPADALDAMRRHYTHDRRHQPVAA